MGLHGVEYVIQKANGLDDMLALVQHHAFGAYAHGGIGDLRARRDSRLGERFEHLCGPDHRYVCGFAQPQDLFLHFGQPFEADLDCQIAARHHDSDGMMAQGRQQGERELVESLAAFDLEDDSQSSLAASLQLPPELQNVLGPADEGQADDIGMLGDESRGRAGLSRSLRRCRDRFPED